MKSSGPSATRRRSIGPLLVLSSAVLAVSGCASPGPARPPSLFLPRTVTDLAAIRTGDSVTLHWTTPEKTTDGLKVKLPLTAEICRQPDGHGNACTPVEHVTVHPGASEATDQLPSSLTSDPPALLIYRVRILNATGHSAGLSTAAFAASGAAPPPIEHLSVTPVRNGAMIEWQPQPTSAFIDLDRTQIQTAAPQKRSGKQPSQLAAPSSPAEIHLQAGRQASQAGTSKSAEQPTADPGGTIDPIAQRNMTYRYTAQRVRSLTLGGHALEIRSVLSPAITTAMRDTFPPATPAGLAAVPGTASIDLSWEPNTEPDLAGYIVYRQAVAADGTLAGAPTRLTPSLISAPAFSDVTAQPGQTYSYRVAAVDSAGNQSPTSGEARESRRNQ